MELIKKPFPFFLILLIMTVAGCVSAPPPIEEWALARAALEAAHAVDSAKYAPGHWSQAEDSYRQAKILFYDKEYADAKELFLKVRAAAEMAENAARLIRHKNGDVL